MVTVTGIWIETKIEIWTCCILIWSETIYTAEVGSGKQSETRTTSMNCFLNACDGACETLKIKNDARKRTRTD